MSTSICGVCCDRCPSGEECRGCAETGGAPFGNRCYIAKYISVGGMEGYQAFKKKLIDEINALGVEGMEKVTELYALVGKFVNLEYTLPNGETVKLLNDDEIYLGAQVGNLFDDSKKTCYGVIAREGFILVCEYGENCTAPEIAVYKRRCG